MSDDKRESPPKATDETILVEARAAAYNLFPPNDLCGYMNLNATLRQGFEMGWIAHKALELTTEIEENYD
jgi:hypothetical protein